MDLDFTTFWIPWSLSSPVYYVLSLPGNPWPGGPLRLPLLRLFRIDPHSPRGCPTRCKRNSDACSRHSSMGTPEIASDLFALKVSAALDIAARRAESRKAAMALVRKGTGADGIHARPSARIAAICLTFTSLPRRRAASAIFIRQP